MYTVRPLNNLFSKKSNWEFYYFHNWRSNRFCKVWIKNGILFPVLIWTPLRIDIFWGPVGVRYAELLLYVKISISSYLRWKCNIATCILETKPFSAKCIRHAAWVVNEWLHDSNISILPWIEKPIPTYTPCRITGLHFDRFCSSICCIIYFVCLQLQFRKSVITNQLT